MDYVKNACVIVSSEEEVKDSIKHAAEENIAYIQEMYQEANGLLKFSMFADFSKAIQAHDVIYVKMFVAVSYTHLDVYKRQLFLCFFTAFSFFLRMRYM